MRLEAGVYKAKKGPNSKLDKIRDEMNAEASKRTDKSRRARKGRNHE